MSACLGLAHSPSKKKRLGNYDIFSTVTDSKINHKNALFVLIKASQRALNMNKSQVLHKVRK